MMPVWRKKRHVLSKSVALIQEWTPGILGNFLQMIPLEDDTAAIILVFLSLCGITFRDVAWETISLHQLTFPCQSIFFLRTKRADQSCRNN